MSLNYLLCPGKQCEPLSCMCTAWMVQSPLFLSLTPDKLVYIFNRLRMMTFTRETFLQEVFWINSNCTLHHSCLCVLGFALWKRSLQQSQQNPYANVFPKLKLPGLFWCSSCPLLKCCCTRSFSLFLLWES